MGLSSTPDHQWLPSQSHSFPEGYDKQDSSQQPRSPAPAGKNPGLPILWTLPVCLRLPWLMAPPCLCSAHPLLGWTYHAFLTFLISSGLTCYHRHLSCSPKTTCKTRLYLVLTSCWSSPSYLKTPLLKLSPGQSSEVRENLACSPISNLITHINLLLQANWSIPGALNYPCHTHPPLCFSKALSCTT